MTSLGRGPSTSLRGARRAIGARGGQEAAAALRRDARPCQSHRGVLRTVEAGGTEGLPIVSQDAVFDDCAVVRLW